MSREKDVADKIYDSITALRAKNPTLLIPESAMVPGAIEALLHAGTITESDIVLTPGKGT